MLATANAWFVLTSRLWCPGSGRKYKRAPEDGPMHPISVVPCCLGLPVYLITAPEPPTVKPKTQDASVTPENDADEP